MPGKAKSTKASGYNWQDLVLIHRVDKPGLSMAMNNQVITLRKSKGADYLYEVLRHPYQSISALQLGYLYANSGYFTPESLGQDISEQGLSIDQSLSLDPVMDTRGIREIKQRLVWLNERCAELISWNDAASLEELNAEREQLITYLTAALYPNGRPRPLESEEIRVVRAVNRSIQRTLEQLCRQDRELGTALQHCVHLGRNIGFFPN
jgi:hypothetical protein